MKASDNSWRGEGKGDLFRVETCPVCGALVNCSKLDRSHYIYCRFCDSVFTRKGEVAVEVLHALLRGGETDTALLAKMCVIEIEAIGDFVTYGVGVSLMKMRNPKLARAGGVGAICAS